MSDTVKMKSNIKRGKFIVFEGGDGCGKTTQTELLCRRIAKETGALCVCEREPDSRDIVGAIIRSALYGSVRLLPESMAYLHVADRLEHIACMLPLLENGTNIVCDRYYISNMAYNATPRLSMEAIYELNRPCIESLPPDAVIFLDVPEDVTRARRQSGRTSEEIYDADGTQRRVRKNYADAVAMLKTKGNNNIFPVDASRSVDEVAEKIWERVRFLFD